MEYNRARMKQEVRQIMRETRPRPIWVTLLYLLIVAAGSWVIQGVIGGIMGINAITNSLESIGGMETFMDPELMLEALAEFVMSNLNIIGGLISGSILISILNYLWSSTMAAGYVGYSLKMVRRQTTDVGSVFSAFPKFGKVLLTNILVGVFTFLWTLLFSVGLLIVVVVAALLTEAAEVIGILLMIVGYVAFIVAILWATLRFALTNHLVMDQDISGLEALNVSKQLMRGNKRRLFVLSLSFIGWYLLELVVIYACAAVMVLAVFLMAEGAMGGIIAGVILLLVMLLVMVVAVLLFSMWLTPYTSGATVKFYEYTMSRRPDLFKPVAGVTTYTDDSFGNPNYPTLD